MKPRDNSIDFFRGLAAISVIFIHTCFWSGTSYVPTSVQSLSLLIDVPLFIFLSGMSFNFSNSIFKTIKGFSKLWYKYVIFVMLYYALIYVFDIHNFSIDNIFSAIFFKFQGNDIFPVVAGSLWFIFMFFIVSILCDGIICIYNKYNKNINDFKYVIMVSFLFYGMSNYTPGFTFLNTQILMYCFIYLLGYYLYNFKVKKPIMLIPIFMTLLFLYIKLNNNNFSLDKIQMYKSTSDFRYLLYSCISLLSVFFLKDKLKINSKNILVFIGKNALLFYFAQGISSSVLYFILPKLVINNWLIKLILMYITNILLTTILSLIIKWLCDMSEKIKYKDIVFFEEKIVEKEEIKKKGKTYTKREK